MIEFEKENVEMDLFLGVYQNPVDNFGTVVGENPTPYGILALWTVNSLSIVHWECLLARA